MLTLAHQMALHFWRIQEPWPGCSRTDLTCAEQSVAIEDCVSALQRRAWPVAERADCGENGSASLSGFGGVRCLSIVGHGRHYLSSISNKVEVQVNGWVQLLS